MTEGNQALVVVVIEDDAQLLHFLQTYLQSRGFEVRSAVNAADGLALLSEVVPCLIICDNMMPGMNGAELCGKVKARPELKSVPFILSSADPSKLPAPSRCTWDFFLRKPYSIQELDKLLEKYASLPVP